MFNVRRALVSVSDKRGLIPFVQGLADLGVEVLSTGGTCRQLREAGLDVAVFEAKRRFQTIADFPRGKPIYTYPSEMEPAGDLRFTADVKEPLLEELAPARAGEAGEGPGLQVDRRGRQAPGLQDGLPEGASVPAGLVDEVHLHDGVVHHNSNQDHRSDEAHGVHTLPREEEGEDGPSRRERALAELEATLPPGIEYRVDSDRARDFRERLFLLVQENLRRYNLTLDQVAAIIGQCLLESGAADAIVRRLLRMLLDRRWQRGAWRKTSTARNQPRRSGW